MKQESNITVERIARMLMRYGILKNRDATHMARRIYKIVSNSNDNKRVLPLVRGGDGEEASGEQA